MMSIVASPSGSLLAFSTLGCPGWDLSMVVERARTWGFDGVEWRGGPDGTVLTGWSPARRREARARIDDVGLRSVAVTAYSELISGRAAVRRASVDSIRAHLDLARDLGARAVRVFLGVCDDDASHETLTGRAMDALASVLHDARAAGVTVAIEPHDDHVRAGAIAPILVRLPDPALGVVWDIANAWAAGEPPADGFAAYADRIAYVQVKDGVGRDASWRLVPVGRGEVPLRDALELLVASAAAADAALPPISIEWERAWHPELDPPDVALPAALRVVRALLPERAAVATRP